MRMLATISYEQVAIGISALTALTNLILFIVFALQLRIFQQQVRDSKDAIERDHKRRRAQATFEFYEATLNKRSKARTKLARDRDHEGVLEMIAEAKSGNKGLTDAITDYLNLMELMATGVLSDTFDLETIERLAGGRIIAISENYRTWFEYRRTTLNSQTIYAEIDELARRIRDRRA